MAPTRFPKADIDLPSDYPMAYGRSVASEAMSMGALSSVGFGRVMIVLAVLMQALGKVAYGTWLGSVPSNLFVFLSFALTAAFFLAVSRRGVGERALGPLLLLNAATALTFIAFFYSLKLIEPAIVGAVEIGIGPVIVVLIALATMGERPSPLRALVCFGILTGCVVLALAALPVLTFAIEGFLSAYTWSWLTALGVAIVSGFLVLDVAGKRR